VRILSSESPNKPNPFFFLSQEERDDSCDDALSACTNAEAIVVATEWKEFRDIDWQAVYDSMNKPAFVFDGRMLLDAQKLREIGFKVTVIGRGDGF
jgi:UDPglucose 6-dehydrogenase